MDFEVIWSDRARSDLREIIEYVALHNRSAAIRIGRAITKQIRLLRVVPLIGSTYRRHYRTIVSGNYRIFFRVWKRAKRVEILTIQHSARQEPYMPEG